MLVTGKNVDYSVVWGGGGLLGFTVAHTSVEEGLYKS